MLTLVLIGLLGGLITGVSPCILPVLPAVFVGGATSETVDDEQEPERDRRPYIVVAGLALSFSVFTLIGSALLDALNLPQDFLRGAGLVVLVAIGIGLIFPRFEDLLERPFSRVPRREAKSEGSGFIFGIGLGVLYVPCAGPVLTAISVASATHHIGPGTIALTLAFAIGTSAPLLAFALAGRGMVARLKSFRERARRVRVVGGFAMIVLALLLTFNMTDFLQRSVPGYTNTLQDKIEGNGSAKKALASLNNNKSAATEALAACGSAPTTSLLDCGPAPEFKGIDQWLNTPNGAPLNLANLKGKVTLIDFWTYSCINCQRSLPHVEAWNKTYESSGFGVIGVHTPEFAFEHVTSNIVSASKTLGVTYPVAVDNEYGTWNAYNNEYWPAEYLVDAAGNVRHVDFGEGGYDTMEKLIRQLLTQANPAITLPPATNVANNTPTATSQTPESYLGYNHAANFDSVEPVTKDAAASYTTSRILPPNAYAYSGTWTIGSESATAGPNAALEIYYNAADVYLVLGGEGSVTIANGGNAPTTMAVTGTPGLYTLVHGTSQQRQLLKLTFTPGVQAYDFTFG